MRWNDVRTEWGAARSGKSRQRGSRKRQRGRHGKTEVRSNAIADDTYCARTWSIESSWIDRLGAIHDGIICRERCVGRVVRHGQHQMRRVSMRARCGGRAIQCCSRDAANRWRGVGAVCKLYNVKLYQSPSTIRRTNDCCAGYAQARVVLFVEKIGRFLSICNAELCRGAGKTPGIIARPADFKGKLDTG